MPPKVAAKKVLNKSPQTADNTFQKTTCLVFTPPPIVEVRCWCSVKCICVIV